MDIIVTKSLLNLLSSVAKTLTLKGGHLMMVGRSGMGRRTSVKIASALYSSKLVMPNTAHLTNDLKYVSVAALMDCKNQTILLSEHK